MNLKIFGKVLTSKSVGTGPSSYEKIIYRDAVSHRLRNNALEATYLDIFTPEPYLTLLDYSALCCPCLSSVAPNRY